MLTKTEKSFSLLFFLIVFAELICGSVESLSQVHYFTKPLILISLIVFFCKQSNHLNKNTRNIALLALIFSLTGDVLLMFVSKSPKFFISGLVAFLLAHIMYILVFLRSRNKTANTLPIIVILLIYASGIFYFLKDGLEDMLIPVLLYLAVILVMASTAFLRRRSNRNSYILIFAGAIFFMISDSLLALNKFYQPLAYSNISIMLTYALAQYFIVLGILKQKD
ncbi:lysoplasmalogenase [Flavobacteriaceae bacterium AH-315-B10]|nr:lysoplasmalogenase [Flavobacteriaceae bacterium AH-315-B10]